MLIFLERLKLNIEIGSCNIITFKNKKCLNCGKEGHIKSNCPQINNQMKCTKCGEFGHFFGQHDLYCAVCDEQYYHNTEGQLISECLFDNLKFSKKTTQNSALEYKKWSNQQNKGTFL